MLKIIIVISGVLLAHLGFANSIADPSSWQTIKYGWVALDGVELTGDTIYVANNTRQIVEQIDWIEVVLGGYERCLVTHYTTNSPFFKVPPYSFIQTFTEKTYTTNNSVVTINVIKTNAFGHYMDINDFRYLIGAKRAGENKIATVDSAIKSTVQYFVDPDTVFNGSENIISLTVAGLFDKLQIGNTTNFTRSPCWTSEVQTVYVIAYTNYWPTNVGEIAGVYDLEGNPYNPSDSYYDSEASRTLITFPTTNIYTSAVNQTVNYAISGTLTGGQVWVTVTNWPSKNIQTINEATYGSGGSASWRKIDLFEMNTTHLTENYKLLTELDLIKAQNTSWTTTIDTNAVPNTTSTQYRASGVCTQINGTFEFYLLTEGHYDLIDSGNIPLSGEIESGWVDGEKRSFEYILDYDFSYCTNKFW